MVPRRFPPCGSRVKVMMRPLVCLVLVVAGCGGGSDPCDGQQGTCLSATVEGSLENLDRLEVSVDGIAQPMASSPGGTFSLPVRMAIVLPSSVGASTSITIDGFGGGQLRGSTGQEPVTLTVNGKSSHT